MDMFIVLAWLLPVAALLGIMFVVYLSRRAAPAPIAEPELCEVNPKLEEPPIELSSSPVKRSARRRKKR